MGVILCTLLRVRLHAALLVVVVVVGFMFYQLKVDVDGSVPSQL
jgi:hypothetical protein